MIRKLTQAIRSRWSGRESARPPPLPPAEVGTAAKTTSSAADALSERLCSIADENARLGSGTLHLISLEDVRDALGEERWDVLSPQVSAAAARMIQHWLSPADVMKPHGDSGLLIEFDAFDEDAGARRASSLSLRLKAALVEQFPQLTDPDRSTGAASSPAKAPGIVLEPFEKSNAQVGDTQGSLREAEPGLWRAALGQATLDLLEAGTVVTKEALVIQLETRRNADSLVLKSASTGAALARLQKLTPGSGG